MVKTLSVLENVVAMPKRKLAPHEQTHEKLGDKGHITFILPNLKHQEEFFDYAEDNHKCLLGDDQGLGKTKQSIDVAMYRKSKYGLKYCLVICGVNSLKYNWMREIKKHTKEEKGYLLGQRQGGWGKIYPGSSKDKFDDLVKVENGEITNFFLIMNVESLRNQDVYDKVFELTNTGEIGMVIVDEIHKACNAESKQGKGIECLQSYFRLALTGTPFMNRVTDLYVPLKWLGVEHATFNYFKNRYCIFGGRGGHAIKGVQNLRELNMKLDKVMIRRLKEDVLDLPPKIRSVEIIPMTPAQEKLYKEVKLMIMANITQIKLSPNPLALLIRLRQATGWTGILSSKIQESAKMERMKEIVDDITSYNELQAERGEKKKKVIVFSNWVQMTDVAMQILKDYNPAYVTGNTKDVMSQIDRFMEDDDCQVIVGTIKALGTGQNLYKASHVIFLDEPWNDSNKKQAEDRAHRIGVEDTVTSTTLLCEGTIDERINEIVEEKAKLNLGVVEGDEEVIHHWDITTEELVDRLLS